MRDIKFRGKTETTEGKKWIYGYLFKVKSFFDEQEQWYIRNDHVLDKVVDSNTIGQYTGLKDKNGTEIYEGDILEIIVNNNIVKKCVVEFKDGIFGVMFTKCKDLTAFPHFHNTTFEILGNIHDNPELLGE
jgi:uncharacterized phage protein (TIGR01671 family)